MRRPLLRTLTVTMAMALATLATADVGRADDPPVITEFSYDNTLGDYFVFFGWVADEDPEGCIVLFGGCLDGYYTSVDADGYFYLVVILEPWQTGMASAIAYDSEYNESNEAYTFVYY